MCKDESPMLVMHRRGAAPPQNSSKSRPRWTAAATSRFNKKRKKKAQQFLGHAQQITPQVDPQDKLWQINYIVILVIADYLFSPFCMVPSLSTSWQRQKKSSRYTINKTVIKLWWLRTQTMRNRRRKEKNNIVSDEPLGWQSSRQSSIMTLGVSGFDPRGPGSLLCDGSGPDWSF